MYKNCKLLFMYKKQNLVIFMYGKQCYGQD